MLANNRHLLFCEGGEVCCGCGGGGAGGGGGPACSVPISYQHLKRNWLQNNLRDLSDYWSGIDRSLSFHLDLWSWKYKHTKGRASNARMFLFRQLYHLEYTIKLL